MNIILLPAPTVLGFSLSNTCNAIRVYKKHNLSSKGGKQKKRRRSKRRKVKKEGQKKEGQKFQARN